MDKCFAWNVKLLCSCVRNPLIVNDNGDCNCGLVDKMRRSGSTTATNIDIESNLEITPLSVSVNESATQI